MKRLFYFSVALFCFALFASASAQAQNSSKTGLYQTTNISVEFSDRWSAYVENQWRSLDGFQKFYYYELKGGLTYSPGKNYSFTVGTGIYETFKEGEHYENYSRQFEHRVWEQFNYEHSLAVLQMDHRFRIEQRFKDEYANRFRYRLKADLPLNSRTIKTNTLYVTAYDELFFTDKAPVFSRNRFHVGAGYKVSKILGISAGWLRQVDFSENSTRRKNYVFTGIDIEL